MRWVERMAGSLAGSVLDDLYRFNPVTVTWTAVSPKSTTPGPRVYFGFTATSDGLLYVFGGDNGGNAEIQSGVA